MYSSDADQYVYPRRWRCGELCNLNLKLPSFVVATAVPLAAVCDPLFSPQLMAEVQPQIAHNCIFSVENVRFLRSRKNDIVVLFYWPALQIANYTAGDPVINTVIL